MIYRLWKAGEAKRLERRKLRVCFHVLAVNMTILHVKAETSFWTPITSRHLDEYFGTFAWNDWFFNEFLTRKELDPKRLLHHKGDGCAKKEAA